MKILKNFLNHDLNNVTWSMGFISYALSNGYRYRPFNVVDDFNREAVSSQSDIENADIKSEKQELEQMPEKEVKELATFTKKEGSMKNQHAK